MTRLVLIGAVAAVAAVGCGGNKPPAYTNVSGKVIVDGKALDKGLISFSAEGYPPSTMDIVDGNYTGQAMIGSNKVSISARRKGESPGGAKAGAQERMAGYKKMLEEKAAHGGGSSSLPDTSTVGLVEMIPKEYNTGSKTTRVVEAGGENKFDFLIKTKN